MSLTATDTFSSHFLFLVARYCFFSDFFFNMKTFVCSSIYLFEQPSVWLGSFLFLFVCLFLPFLLVSLGNFMSCQPLRATFRQITH